MKMGEIQKVGVAGLGLMGSGIAQVLLTSGYEVWAMEASDELYEKGIARVKGGLNKWAQKQGKTEQDVEQLLKKIHQARNPEDFHPCQAFIEAIIENVEEKKKLFRSLNPLAEKMEFIATNTSSIPIAELASAFDVPHRPKFLGMHFFNPVPIMKLIELIPCVETSPQVLEKVKQFGETLGKTTVVSRDVPAFIVNNLLVPYILDAIRLVEQGVATKEDVDKAMKLGTNVPMGPFELLDFVGLDTTLYIADICYNLTKDPRFAAPNLLRQMVALGYTGRKAGRGFYRLFVAGETREDALRVAYILNQQGYACILNFLGEFVESPQVSEQNLREYLGLLQDIAERKLKSTIAVKLTQLGVMIDKNLARQNLKMLLEKTRELNLFFRIDMENSPFVDVTLKLYQEFYPEFSPYFGIVLQSTLHRTEKDLEKLLPLPPNIRLVKGAYLEPPSIAYPGKNDVDANYLRLMKMLFSYEKMKNGGFVAIATHDEKILRQAIEQMQAYQFPRENMEFQFLYGIRRDLQQRMKDAGFPVRIYIPYGQEWYGYFLRRLAERPANLWFVLRHLFR